MPELQPNNDRLASSQQSPGRGWLTISVLTFFALAASFLGGCGGGLKPAQLRLDEDACTYCRMAVSQRRFAAQAVQASRVDFFDDVGCLAAWIKEAPPPSATALYVADYGSGEWIPAENASYVRSQAIPSPMSYGIAAWTDSRQAAEWAQEVEGRVLTWTQVVQEVQP